MSRLFLTVVLTIVLLIGCTSHQTPPSSDVLKQKEDLPTVLISYDGQIVKKIITSYDTIYPDSGNIFIKVYMNITNKGYDEVSTNPNNFHLIYKNIKYDYDWNTPLSSSPLASVDILNNGQVSGSLLFQVPYDDKETSFSMDYDGLCSGFQVCDVTWTS